MRITYKVLIWHDGKEYTSYIIDADTKPQAERQAVAAFAKKHNVSKTKLISHAYTLNEEVPNVMRVQVFPGGGKRGERSRVGVRYNPLKLKQFKYIVSLKYKDNRNNILSDSVEVISSDTNAALIDGKRKITQRLGNVKVVNWSSRKVG